MPETKQQHNIVYRVLGALKVAAKNRKVAGSFNNLKKSISQFKAGLLGMRGMMMGAAASLVAIGLGIRKTITEYEKYTVAQSKLRSTLAATIPNYRESASAVGRVAEAVGIDLGYSLSEANEAMTTMIQTGIGVHASMRVFRSSMRLARIAEMDTENATRFLVDTMNMFKKEMVTDDLTLQQFADRMSGQLAVAANMAATDINSLQQAFRYAGTELSSLGFSSREVVSALAGLSAVGLRGTTAGTRLRGAMLAMVNPSDKVKKAIHELTGEEEAWKQVLHDSEGKLVKFPDVIKNLQNILGRTTTTQERHNLITQIFGRRAFAAGVSMAEMNEAAMKMLEVYETLGDEHMVQSRLLKMEEERMKSFGMQMQQLREGASDMAVTFGEILFGAMDDSKKGFGTYIRELAQGVRWMGLMAKGDEQARMEFEKLDPAVQKTAKEIREFMKDGAKALKWLWGWVKWAAKFTVEHPKLVGALILIKLAFGGVVSGVVNATKGIGLFYNGLAMAGKVISGPNGLSTVSKGANAAIGAVGLLALDLTSRVTRALQSYAVKVMGAEKELENLRETTIAAHAETLKYIPVVGGLLSQYVELAGWLQKVNQVEKEIADRREKERKRTIEATAQERTTAYADRIRGTSATTGMTESQILEQANMAEYSRSRMEAATMMFAGGIRSEDSVSNELKRAGFTGQELKKLTWEIQDLQTGMSRDDALSGIRLSGGEGSWGRAGRLNMEGLRKSTDQLANFKRALNAATVELEMDNATPWMDPQTEQPVQDAYVRRGGFLNVSSGDMVVSRTHLADAMAANRGALAGPMVGAPSGSNMVGPAPSTSGGGGGELVLTIPIMLDGREIARANGRANIRQLERGGGNIQPGQRRSLRETGFARNV